MKGWTKFVIILFAVFFVISFVIYGLQVYGNIISQALMHLASPYIPEKIEGFLILLIFLIFPCAVVLLIIGIKKKCPQCKKLFAMKKVRGKEVVSKQDRNIEVENAMYNNDDIKIGHTSQWVQGKRYTFRENYVCQHCGYKKAKTYSKDYVN